jgi:hypothetical protein
VNGYPGLLTALGLAAGILSGCATSATTATTQVDCYPHMYLDSRYAIRGTSLAAGPTVRDGTCYNFVYKDGRIVRVDYRLDGALTPDPTSGVATIRVEHSGATEKRIFLDAAGQPAPNLDGIYAVALTHDDKGRPLEWRNLGADGRPKEAKDSGLAIFRWQVNPQGQVIEESHLGANERLKADLIETMSYERRAPLNSSSL